MAKLYQHWVGDMLVEASHCTAAKHGVDEWIPCGKPAGAELLTTEEIVEPSDVFNNVLALKARIGPAKVTINVDLSFTGTIEYWQLK